MQLRKFSGSAGHLAGFSVALAGDRAVVGAPGSPVNGEKSGLVREYSIETGNTIFNFTPEDPGVNHLFGYSVVATPDLIVVGAPGHTQVDGVQEAGAGYVFDTRTGEQLQRLLAPGRRYKDFAGWNVEVCAQRVLMGSLGALNPQNSTSFAVLFNPVAGRLSLSSLGRQGDAAANVQHTRHVAFGDAVLNQTGHTAFSSTLSGPGAAGGKNRAAFCTVQFPDSVELMALSGQTVNGGRRITSLSQPLMSGFPITYFQARFQGAGGGRMLLTVFPDGFAMQMVPLLVEGSTPDWTAGKRIARLVQTVAPTEGSGDVAALGQFSQGVGGVTSANDCFLASLQISGDPNSVLQEGVALSNGGNLGQMGRVAFATDRVVCHAGIYNQTGVGQGLFLCNPVTGTQTEIARQGGAPGNPTGTTHQTFLGETISLDQWVLHRSTLAGTGVTSANREIIRMSKLLLMPQTVARTGQQVPGLPAGVVWSRFLNYWIANSQQAFILGRVAGPGVNSTNDLVLWLRQENGTGRLLLREGDWVPGFDSVRVGVIQRVSGENKQGAYSVLISLRGAPAGRKQMLLTGRTGGSGVGLGALRQPYPRLTKGGLYQDTGGVPLRLTSLSWATSINDATGAVAKGLGQVITPSGEIVLKVRMSEGRNALLKGRP